MSLKSVKAKIKSIDKTRQVTKAMESVSAVKMRKSQQVAIGTRTYALSALKILRSISGSIETGNQPLMETRKVKRTLLIIVSADKGLAGSYGSTLLKGVYRFMKTNTLTSENTELITIGKKAYEHFHKRGFTIHLHFNKWSDHVDQELIHPVTEVIRHKFLKKEYDAVYIIYTNFISTLKQEVYARRMLPVSFESVEEIIRGITPEKGKFAELASDDTLTSTPVKEVTLEPDPETILNDLLPILFSIQIYHSILEANASEHSARMIAMKNASDNAAELSRSLKLKYNKVRQAAITREVSEIVGGMESMRVID